MSSAAMKSVGRIFVWVVDQVIGDQVIKFLVFVCNVLGLTLSFSDLALLNDPIIRGAVLVGSGSLTALMIAVGYRQLFPAPTPSSPSHAVTSWPRANTEEWRGVDPIHIWRAGYLWGGWYPVSHEVQYVHPAHPSFTMLMTAAETGQLELAKAEPVSNLCWSLVSRKSLKAFALIKGDLPEFLKDSPTLAHAPLRMKVWDVIWRRWQILEEGHLPGQLELLSTAVDEFTEAAKNQRLHVWGKRDRIMGHEEIPSLFWEDGSIDVLESMREHNDGGVAHAGLHGKQYVALRVLTADVEQIWPNLLSYTPKEWEKFVYK